MRRFTLPMLCLAGMLGLASCGGGGGGPSNSATASSRLQPPPTLNGLSLTPTVASPDRVVTASTQCVGTGTVRYRWDFGDGTAFETSEAHATHIYDSGGQASLKPSYNVTIECVDESGQTARAASWLTMSLIDLASVASLDCSAGGAGRGWCRQYPATVTPTIVSAAVLDRANQYGLSSGQLVASHDGGKSWRVQDVHTGNALLALSAFRGRTAWAVGVAGTILKTSDGGASWQTQVSRTTQTIGQVVAINDQTAWAGNGSLVLRTTDGGQTWTVQHDGNPLGPALGAMTALDGQQAWSAYDGTVWHTTDGGVHWQDHPLPGKAWVTSLSASSSKVVWATTSTLPPQVLMSEDGGATWASSLTLDDPPFLVPDASRFAKVLAVGDGEAWLVGNRRRPDSDPAFNTSILWHKAGRDHPWDTTTHGVFGVSLYDIVSQDGKVQWLYGDNAVFHLDGGGAWTVASRTPQDVVGLHGLIAASSQIAWVLGADGGILRTDDGGVGWHPQNSGVTSSLRAMTAANADMAWIVGADPGILTTINGGAVWTRQARDQGAWTSISAASTQVVWAAGSGGRISKTTDGGASWPAQKSGTGDDIGFIQAVSVDEAWAVATPAAFASNDTLLRVVHGDTWSTIPTPLPAGQGWRIRIIQAPSAGVVWLLARTGVDSALLLRRVDEKSGWQTCTLPASPRILTMAAIDASHAWLGDALGTWKTSDGCLTWKRQATNGAAIRQLTAVDTQTLWAIDSAGFIYKTLTGGD